THTHTHTHTHYANVLTGGARAEYNTNKLNTQESLRNSSLRKSEEFVAIIFVIAGLTRNLQIKESAMNCFAPLAMKQPPSTMLPHCSLLWISSILKLFK
ncbi:MAG: hypothetical protein LBT04_07010, partial [Prevotellaceae bacterium]|nr:hypothetical protein [Prevotellaceae bacterium]